MHRALVCAAFLLLAPSHASALTLDFREFAHGAIVGASQGVTITTVNRGGGPNLGVAFDTNSRDTADPDLERSRGGWSGGNLPGHVDLARILIIQENEAGCSDGQCSRPDDEGSRPAGFFDFDFSGVGSFTSLQFDLVDVESATMEAGRVEVFSGTTGLGSIPFTAFLDDPSVAFGDNTANRIAPLDLAALGAPGAFDRVRISLGGSGGVDNVTVGAPVPEPGAALVFGLGLAAVGARARRRQA